MLDDFKFFGLSNITLGLLCILNYFILIYTFFYSPYSDTFLILILAPIIFVFGFPLANMFVVILSPWYGFLGFLVFVFLFYGYLRVFKRLESSIYFLTGLICLITAIIYIIFPILGMIIRFEDLFSTSHTIFWRVGYILAVILISNLVLIGISLRRLGDDLGLNGLKNSGSLTIIGAFILGLVVPIVLILTYVELSKI